MTTDFTAEQAHAAAARGAAWMDKHCPDWDREINIEELDLGDSQYCILGQTASCLVPDATFADYGAVVEELWPLAENRTATRLGFNVPRAIRTYEFGYEMLTIAWRELIRQRLEARR